MNANKKDVSKLICLFVVCSVSLCAWFWQRPKVEVAIDNYIQAFVNEGFFSGTVLVAKGGKIILCKGYGMANYEHMVINTPHTKFHIGSMTKQFTSMAIMQLVQEGKLALSDTVISLLPEYPIDKAITVYHLLTMSSGLPDYINDVKELDIVKPTTLHDLLKSIKYEPLHFTPGSAYKYCNTGYMLLRAIIEKLSQQNYETYLQMHIFEPLGMKASGVLHNKPLLAHRAQGYDLASKKLENAIYFDPSFMVGTGGLYSTVQDLYLWDRALYTDKLLAADLRKQLWQPYHESYCLGWQKGDLDGHEYVWHSGDWAGCSTKIVRFIHDDICIIVLSNLSDAHGNVNYMSSFINKICNNVAAILFGKKPFVSIKINPSLYDAYVGKYELEAGPDKKVVFTITKDHDELFFQPPGLNQKPFKIWPASETSFFSDDETYLSMSFGKDTAGNVTKLIFHAGGNDIVAKKVA